jgi:hypothetical protein
MKPIIYRLIYSTLAMGAWMIASGQAIAQDFPHTNSPVRLSLDNPIRSLAGDLNYPSASERFFREGRAEFELEIQQFSHQAQKLPEGLLKISPALQIPPEFQPCPSPRVDLVLPCPPPQIDLVQPGTKPSP